MRSTQVNKKIGEDRRGDVRVRPGKREKIILVGKLRAEGDCGRDAEGEDSKEIYKEKGELKMTPGRKNHVTSAREWNKKRGDQGRAYE